MRFFPELATLVCFEHPLPRLSVFPLSHFFPRGKREESDKARKICSPIYFLSPFSNGFSSVYLSNSSPCRSSEKAMHFISFEIVFSMLENLASFSI